MPKRIPGFSARRAPVLAMKRRGAQGDGSVHSVSGRDQSSLG